MSEIDIPTWTALFVALSVPLVAAIRRCSWPDLVVTGLALLTVAAAYTLGQFFDQRLTWPLAPTFLGGLLAAFGSQQLLFQAVKRTDTMQALANMGESPLPDPPLTRAEVRRIATQIIADALITSAPRPSRATAGSAGATSAPTARATSPAPGSRGEGA